MPSRQVIVDGSNLATEGRSLPSLVQLDQAVREYIAENPDDVVTVVVDASFGHRIDPSEVPTFEAAEAAGEVVSPPAGAIGRGDAFLLRIAEKTGATVLSNDSFQEFHGEHPWLFDKGRLIGGKPVPGVGWIFMPRTPVRGQKSREVVKEAKRKKRAEVGAGSDAVGTGLDMATSRTKGRAKKVDRAIARATEEAVEPKSGPRRRRRTGQPPAEPVNEPLAFITFIAAHSLGSEVTGTVTEFSSHGAFVDADGARCYLPLSAMADPPPRRAREVLAKGEERAFVVQALDPPRRGVELALPGFARVAGGPTDETVEAEIHPEPAPRPKRRRAPTPAQPGGTDDGRVAALVGHGAAAATPLPTAGRTAGNASHPDRGAPRSVPVSTLTPPAATAEGVAAAKRRSRPPTSAPQLRASGDLAAPAPAPAQKGGPPSAPSDAESQVVDRAGPSRPPVAKTAKAAKAAKAGPARSDSTGRSAKARAAAPAEKTVSVSGSGGVEPAATKKVSPPKRSAQKTAVAARPATPKQPAATTPPGAKKAARPPTDQAVPSGPEKKAPEKKAPAKKAPAKRAPVKKASANKAPVKKAPVKKVTGPEPPDKAAAPAAGTAAQPTAKKATRAPARQQSPGPVAGRAAEASVPGQTAGPATRARASSAKKSSHAGVRDAP